MASSITSDVIVVGCGPTGLVLSILLAQRGHAVTLLERHHSLYPLPRAAHFDHEVGRILQSCGIGAALREIIEPADIYEWRNGAGETLLRFGWRGETPSGWPISSMFSQPDLEDLLNRRASECSSIRLVRGAEVNSLWQSQDAVEVRTTTDQTFRADYVIGADGARSIIRSLLDIETTDLGFFYDWLVVDVIPNEVRIYDPINLQICDPARPTSVISGGPGRRRWEFMVLPHESVEEISTESKTWELLEPWDITPENARLERFTNYRFHACYSDQWRKGRVLLAGDAAHQMPPFAGQGMCSGIRDSMNLAWKLDFVLTGRASDALLDSYASERLPQVRQTIDFAIALGKVICVPDLQEAHQRDLAMKRMVSDELTEGPGQPGIDTGIIDHSTGAGQLFPQGSINGELFDDVHGVGWRLITIDNNTLDDDAANWFRSIDGDVIVIADNQGALGKWFDAHDCSWALQRPDFTVFGTATNAPEASSMINRLRQFIQP